MPKAVTDRLDGKEILRLWVTGAKGTEFQVVTKGRGRQKSAGGRSWSQEVWLGGCGRRPRKS